MTDKPTYARANKILDRTCRQYGFDEIDVRMALVEQLHRMAGARIEGGSDADVRKHAAKRRAAMYRDGAVNGSTKH